MHEPSAFAFEMGIQKLKIHKSRSIDQIPQNWLKRRVEQFAVRELHKLIISVQNKEEFPEKKNESIIVYWL